ncbi:UNKNOWN [Stylonychia lemnae]|uniref:Uncharacterized protein n=1 Tax=Stylonychia lemnae TaxID=5949 RepID=A0A078B7C6_STYLE|nr:UNKNOWN [Stylonychia lemnae]|eukprot:CDW89207.1 UNKNOWN [Stylonychia lemnae]
MNDQSRKNLKESRNTYTHRSINDLALKENFNYSNLREEDLRSSANQNSSILQRSQDMSAHNLEFLKKLDFHQNQIKKYENFLNDIRKLNGTFYPQKLQEQSQVETQQNANLNQTEIKSHKAFTTPSRTVSAGASRTQNQNERLLTSSSVFIQMSDNNQNKQRQDKQVPMITIPPSNLTIQIPQNNNNSTTNSYTANGLISCMPSSGANTQRYNQSSSRSAYQHFSINLNPCLPFTPTNNNDYTLKSSNSSTHRQFGGGSSVGLFNNRQSSNQSTSRKLDNSDIRIVYTKKEEQLTKSRISDLNQSQNDQVRRRTDEMPLQMSSKPVSGRPSIQNLTRKDSSVHSESTNENQPITINKLTFEQLVEKEMNKQEPVYKNMQSANQNNDEVVIFEAEVSEIKQKDGSSALSLEHLNNLDSIKIITPKPFLKKGEGFIIKKIDNKNDFFKEQSVRKSQSLESYASPQQRSKSSCKMMNKKTKKQQILQQLNQAQQKSQRCGNQTRNTSQPTRTLSQSNRPKSSQKQLNTERKQQTPQQSANSSIMQQSFKIDNSMTLNKSMSSLKSLNSSLIKQNKTTRNRPSGKQANTLYQISEGEELLDNMKQAEIIRIEKEIEKLAKKKTIQEKDVRSKLEVHLKMITQLKSELKKRESEVKESQKKMKEKIEMLEKENNTLKKQQKLQQTQVLKVVKDSNAENKNKINQILQQSQMSQNHSAAIIKKHNFNPPEITQSKTTTNKTTNAVRKSSKNQITSQKSQSQSLGAKLRGAIQKQQKSRQASPTHPYFENKTSFVRDFQRSPVADRADSAASFERNERRIIEEGLVQKLKLDPKYSLQNQEIKFKTWNEEGTVEILYTDETKEFHMSNGIKKRVYNDGLIILTMPNNDIKVCQPNGQQRSFYAEEITLDSQNQIENKENIPLIAREDLDQYES